jgi:hypothetical protein
MPARRLFPLLLVVLAPTSLLAGPLTPSFDPRWWERDGVPFFMCGPGDPEGYLYRGTLQPDGTRSGGDQDAIISKLAGTNANCIWMATIRSHGGDGDGTENPFVDHDPAHGVNPVVLDQWEGWISALNAAGIVTFLTFYDDSARPWDTGDTVSQAEQDFFETLVNRFESYDLIIWNIAEEYQERYSRTRISALAAIVAAADDFGHPVSCHQTPGSHGHFPDDPNLDSHAVQGSGPDTSAGLHQKALDAWDFSAGRYLVNFAESRLQFEQGRDESRRLCWAAAMAGAYVMVHKMDVANTPVEALDDCGRLRTFFGSTPFHLMAPHDELAQGETDWVFGETGVGWIVYGESVAGNLGLTIPLGGDGEFDLRWMDTENGTTVVQAGVNLAAGNHVWAKPPTLGAEVALSVLPVSVTSVSAGVEATSWGHVKGRYRGR